MTQFTTFKNGKIAYREYGSGRCVVLLHGFLESQRMWEDYAAELSKRWRVITIDLPGHGASDCFGYVHSMDLMAEAVKAVLDHLTIRKAALIGHSMGGYTALAFADHYPDLLKGLGLFFSTARADSAEKKVNRDRAIQLVKKNHRGFIRAAIPQLFRPKNRKVFREAVNDLKKQALETPKQGIIACLEGMKTRPNREVILRFAPCPVMIVAGDKDPVIPVESVIEQTRLPESNCYTTILKGCGHMGFIEARDESLKAIAGFVRKAY